MPRFLSLSALASLLLFAVPVQAQDLLQWETDLATAQKQAAATNRLVLVHFGASWCQPCKEMERTVFSKPGLGNVVSPYYVAVKLQLDGDPKAEAVARQFQVKSLPTDIIMTPQGTVVSQSLGFVPADKYAAMLNTVAQQSLAQARSNGLAPAAAPPAPTAPAAAAPPVGAAPVSATPPTSPAARYAAPQPTADNRYAAYAPAVAAQVNVPPVANPAVVSSGADDRYAAYYQSRGLAAPTAPATTVRSAPTAVATPAVAAAPAAPATASDNRYAAPAYTTPPTTVAAPPAAAAAPVAPTASAPVVPPAAAPVAATPAPTTTAPVAASPVAAAASVATNPASNPAAAAPAAASQASLESQLPPGSPPLALEGYCPVTVIDKMVWTKGNARFGAIHLGRTYLFPTAEMQQKFLANPDRYAPIISGNDPVVALEKNEIVPGRRQHGLVYENRMILFSSRESYDKFVKESKRYTTELQQALQSSNAVRR